MERVRHEREEERKVEDKESGRKYPLRMATKEEMQNREIKTSWTIKGKEKTHNRGKKEDDTTGTKTTHHTVSQKSLLQVRG